MEWLYNKKGQAKLFKYGDRFISCKGKNLAWIYSENVYNIRTGKHIGWYEKGVLYDRNNNVIAFTEGYIYVNGIITSLCAVGVQVILFVIYRRRKQV